MTTNTPLTDIEIIQCGYCGYATELPQEQLLKANAHKIKRWMCPKCKAIHSPNITIQKVPKPPFYLRN